MSKNGNLIDPNNLVDGFANFFDEKIKEIEKEVKIDNNDYKCEQLTNMILNYMKEKDVREAIL